MQDPNYLYRTLVLGRFVQFQFTLCLIFAFHILLFLTLRALPRKRFDVQTELFVRETRSFRHSYFLALWLTVVGYLAWAWLLTIYKQAPIDAYRVGWYLVASAIIIALTFVLEGLEIAFTDLRDKDPRQVGIITFEQARKMRGSFYEAREWAVVLLLVIATLMIESDSYELPYLASTGDVQEGWGKVTRIILSIVLTTFPFVWFAQSPSKAVARNNSLAFLSYKGSQIIAAALQVMRTVLGVLGLQFPSEEGEDAAFALLKLCRLKRNLPPSEFSFFASSLRKYGCGFLVSSDRLVIEEDGACEFISRAVIYVSSPRKSVKRYFDFESGFVADTVARLEDSASGDSSCWAFRAPLVGERVTDEDVATWNSLLFAESPDNWPLPLGYTKDYADQFQVNAEIKNPHGHIQPGKRPSYRLDIELEFPKPLPSKSANKGGTESLIVLWRLRAATNAGTVLFPAARNTSKEYPFTKKYSLPCLRSTLTAELKNSVGSAYRFDYPSRFEVSYEGVDQDEERERFESQDRPEPPPDLASTKCEDMTKLVFYVDSPLPAGEYTYGMQFQHSSKFGHMVNLIAAGVMIDPAAKTHEIDSQGTNSVTPAISAAEIAAAGAGDPEIPAAGDGDPEIAAAGGGGTEIAAATSNRSVEYREDDLGVAPAEV